jgi:nucleotide-binding universal stress UspA family protein
MPFRCILLATDFSDHAIEAARVSVELATAFDSRLVFLHVFDVGALPIINAYPYYYGQINQQMVDDMRVRAESALGAFADQHKGARTVERTMVVGRPAGQIIEQAQALSADLIIMGARGIGKVQEILLGSVVHKVVGHAPCPVLTVQKH